MKRGDLLKCIDSHEESLFKVGDIVEIDEVDPEYENIVRVKLPDGTYMWAARLHFEPVAFTPKAQVSVTRPLVEIENEFLIAFDVDDTLVLDRKGAELSGDAIALTNPYSGSVLHRIPHVRHIELLKQQKSRGRFVVVWSGGGVKWAQHVVEKLGLLEFVDMILTKPIGYVDDQHSSEWLNNKIYLPHED